MYEIRNVHSVIKLTDNLPLPLKGRLYNDTSAKNFDISEISDYLKGKGLFSELEIRGSFIEEYGKPYDKAAKKIAETRVRNLESSERDLEVSKGDIEFENELIENPYRGMTRRIYDGFLLSQVFSDFIPKEERNEDHLHLIFTDRFFGTWKPETQRYHSRVSVYGFPSIISTTGIVDAPARPRGFYKIERSDDKPKVEEYEKRFEGTFVDYDDERLTEIMKGYSMHAVFYYLTDETFCDDNKCRLYNPHLQKNILAAQLTEPEFCEEHQKILKNLQQMAKK